MRRRVQDSDKHNLSRSVSAEEVESVMLSMKIGKTPLSDGFTIEFYKDTWPIIKNSVIDAVKDFFATSHMPRFFNSTTITLIPKVSCPQHMRDFRPISCFNTIYKCITTILTNRLKVTLQNVGGKQQTTYVPSRHIADGILLMQELVCGYHKSSGKPRCALKVDIMKAYDTVRWEFLWDVMDVLGYPLVFVNWIKACVSSAWFSISINGSLQGHFQSSRGLRQGDPLSSYLFILVMDYFTELLKKSIGNSGFVYHPMCKEIELVNVNFADDLFILYAANEGSVKIINKVLKLFGNVSDLHPNLSKSTCYFAGVNSEEELRLSSMLGMYVSTLPVRYLGIPLTTK
ncbi:hypothetical protein LIER_40685 [Lithospermum erythrorhizon]|uniref:Reverse transcriptase domain-containing protein n=1 Tax=Lithospermum erythrorhizon TaxID=34254 RepID=A0AAV3R1B0_LITER